MAALFHLRNPKIQIHGVVSEAIDLLLRERQRERDVEGVVVEGVKLSSFFWEFLRDRYVRELTLFQRLKRAAM